jgi:hypothetical protein
LHWKCSGGAGFALAKCAQVAERIQTARVSIKPAELQRVIANGRQVVEFELVVAWLAKCDRAFVALAAGAGAVASQDSMRILPLVTIGPVDFE